MRLMFTSLAEQAGAQVATAAQAAAALRRRVLPVVGIVARRPSGRRG